MKDILKELDPKVHRNYRRFRAAVLEAWELITDKEIRDLIHTMPQRCKDVIDAGRGPTKW